MSDPDEFRELIGQVRAGVEGAATQLARKFEPFVLRYARFRMRSLRNYDRMRPQFGSSDICQSVFKSLFEGLRDGRFELSQPEHLEKLLCTMARLKIATNARKLGVVLREIFGAEALDRRSAPGPGPQKQVDDDDLLAAIYQHFSPEEMELLALRFDGKSWDDIARESGGTLDAPRKRLARAIERVRGRFAEAGLSTT
jgi:DNA-directed RNA polymerase specialized sigma24 family protein